MVSRTTLAPTFRTRLEFKQYDIILRTELLTKIMSSFAGETTQTQYNVLNCRIDLCFHEYKLAIKIDENRNSDRNIDYKINRQQVIEQELGSKFIRINPDKEELDIFIAFYTLPDCN